MKQQASAAIGVVVVLAGCSGGLFGELGERVGTPEVVAPTIRSFAVEGRITASWEQDGAADTYLLYRDEVPAPTTPTVIYRGRASRYEDSEVEVNRNYYYRLAKQRGERVFGPSRYVYAVTSNVRWEASEPNDEVGTAAAFSHGVQGSLYAFRDGLGNRIIDVDWYRIEVGPFRRTTMQFTDYRNLPTANSVVVVVRGEREVPVNSGDSIAIDNYSNRTRSMYFRVTIDPAEFFVRVGSGGGVGSYRINLVTIGSL